MAKIKVTLIKSPIGTLAKQKANIAALGLTKIGTSRIHDDNAVIRGMVNVVTHLVKVENVD